MCRKLFGAMQTAGTRLAERANAAGMVSAEVFNAFLRLLEAHESMRALLGTGLPKKGLPGVPERARFHRMLTRQGHSFSAEQRAQVEEWQTLLCQHLASLLALQRQFDKFLLVKHTDELANLQKPSLKAPFHAHAAKEDKELRIGKDFMTLGYPKLSPRTAGSIR